jgi:UDP-N-acetylmuramate--alanine ligase
MSGSFRFGDGNVFVYEACEYKNSFLHTNPTISVLLNIDYDHADFFKSIEDVTKSFGEFSQLPYKNNEKNPLAILNVDDERLLDISKDLPLSVTFGIYNRDADYLAVNLVEKNGYYTFDILKNGLQEETIELTVPGKHNIYNALAAYAVADACGVGQEEAKDALEDFEGTKRRFEYVGSYSGANVYIDYAHHPSEIEAVIKTARTMTKKRVIVVFEPHTYSRTKSLYEDFIRVLSEADSVILTDIYPARETDDLGMSSEKMSMDINGACYAPVYDSAVSVVRTESEKGDIILVLGAGSIYKVGKMIVNE